MLSQVLRVLMRGCGAAAFHGLIRTSYAVQASHTRELADALAHWACRHRVLGDAPSGSETDPMVLLLAMKEALPDWSSEQNSIIEQYLLLPAEPLHESPPFERRQEPRHHYL